MRTFRKHQYKDWVLEYTVGGDVRLKNETFGLDAG